MTRHWLWILVALAIVILLDRGTPAQAQPSPSCDDRQARALEELATQSRRQTAALEKIADRLK